MFTRSLIILMISIVGVTMNIKAEQKTERFTLLTQEENNAASLSTVGVTKNLKAEQKIKRLTLLNQVKNKAESLSTYKCIMHLKTYGANAQEQNQLLLFKKPGFVRIDQLGPYRDGASVVLDPERKDIHGHLGGFLSIFTIKLSSDDERLNGITGDSAITADYSSIIAAAIEAESQVVSYNIHQITKGQRNFYLLESKTKGPITQHNLLIDKEKLLIVKYDRFQGDQLISTVEWSEIELDIELKDEFFSL